ncbi:MAG: hypothetical protein H6807_01585 [Planctomycetes bacterium]|nr:hypothetical protein [Planctomycetota bacterium]
MKRLTGIEKRSRATILLFALVFLTQAGVSLLLGQEPEGKGPVDDETFSRDTVGLLEVGFGDAEVIAHWNRRGWPKSVTANALVRAREAGAGLDLLARIRALLPSGTEYSRLVDILEHHEIDLGGRRRLRFLRPRGYVVEKLDEAGRRQAFHDQAAQLEGWFRRTSFFVFVYDAGQWRSHNEAALSRIVVDAMRRRLELAAFEVGELAEESLINKRSNLEFALYSTIGRDPKNELRGVVAASARVLDDAGVVVVMGFCARLDAANPVVPDCKTKLSEMLSSMLVSP